MQSTLTRVDKIIKQRFPSLSKRQISEALENNFITLLDKKPLKKGVRLDDSAIDFSDFNQHLEKLEKGNSELQIPIIFENENFWVINKPAGIASHPLHILDYTTVTHWAFSQNPNLKNEFNEIQPALAPHRLDTGTSGLLIVCKNKKSFDYWREQFTNKKVTKKYQAWCWGSAEIGAEFVNEREIAHHTKNNSKMVIAEGNFRKPVLKAKTNFKVIQKHETLEAVLLEAETNSGVTHQVRVHATDLGFPLLGDNLYDEKFERRETRLRYHQLTATEIKAEEFSFVLPIFPSR
jgi:23S rRNA pseudouridine1911/1915/1917 synthase